jgi:tetratricopeptide (TPR) repeat protein
MARSNAPVLPSPTPEHRRIAAGQFERANQVVTTGNFDYGIRLLLSCCKLDPANLIYRQKLRATEKVKYRNNQRGSLFARLTAWPARARLKGALRKRDYLKALEYGEQILVRNPWDVGAQMDMAEAANVLGLLDLAIWYLEQAHQTQALDPHLNRTLARLYEKRGNFTQAIALWELVRKARPSDNEALHKIKDLAADDTIARGQYAAVIAEASRPEEETATDNAPLPEAGTGSGAHRKLRPTPPAGTEAPRKSQQGSPSGSGIHRKLTPAPAPETVEGPAVTDRAGREAAPLRARLEADPTTASLYLQLANVYRRNDQVEQARAVLQEGLGPTGNAFELGIELADLDIEPFRRNLAITEEKLKAAPDDPDLRKLRVRLRKEINSRELDVFRRKADRFPTEMGHRYEVGVRLLRAGQIDEAIRELQASRADPRHRWQSLKNLGHCFKARNNWRLAQRNFEEALSFLPVGEVNVRKEILFELATGCAEANDLGHAIDVAHELANLDFSYRNIGRLLDEWQVKLEQSNGVRH